MSSYIENTQLLAYVCANKWRKEIPPQDQLGLMVVVLVDRGLLHETIFPIWHESAKEETECCGRIPAASQWGPPPPRSADRGWVSFTTRAGTRCRYSPISPTWGAAGTNLLNWTRKQIGFGETIQLILGIQVKESVGFFFGLWSKLYFFRLGGSGTVPPGAREAVARCLSMQERQIPPQNVPMFFVIFFFVYKASSRWPPPMEQPVGQYSPKHNIVTFFYT